MAFALWWNFVLSVRYVYANRKKKGQIVLMSTTTQPVFFLSTKRLRLFPFESYVKAVLAVALYIWDISIFRREPDNILTMDVIRIQHGSWFYLFGLQALVEILAYHECYRFPDNCEYFFFLSWAFMHMFGWTIHVVKKENLDFTLHLFVSYLMIVKTVAILIETIDRNLYWPVFVRCLTTLVQGSWILQIVFVLLPTAHGYKWTNDVMDQMWLENYFLFHVAGCICVMMGEYFFVYLTYPFWIDSFEKYLRDYEQSDQNSLTVELDN